MPLSRRAFLLNSTAAAAAASTIGLSGSAASAVVHAAELAPAELTALGSPLMLTVADAAKGELEILVGEVAIPFKDKSLVNKLARAARQGTTDVIAP